MLKKIEMTGKKAANIVIIGGCYGVELASEMIGSVAAVGELTCYAIRMGSECIEEKANEMVKKGGPFKLDEEKSKERAEEILTQYL